MRRPKMLPHDKLKVWIEQNKLVEIPCNNPFMSPCLVWTGCRKDGKYGLIGYMNKTYYIHRFYLWLSTKAFDLFDDTIYICHSCDNIICVRHVYIGSALTNTRDAIKAGTFKPQFKPGSKHPYAKLTIEQVREIRRLCETPGQQPKIAKIFGITQDNVSRIKNRIRWNVD